MNLICHRMLFCLLLCMLSLQSMASPVTVIDDTGQTVALDQPARRIVSLAPHITELLFAAGAGDNIVGVVEYSDYPEAAKKITNIGSATQLDLEILLALKPDLVVVWDSGNPKALVEKIEALGFKVFRSEPRQLEDVAANLEALGVLAGSEEKASQAAAIFRQQLQQLRQQNAQKTKVRVFYQIWHQPLMTINGQHLISKVIELCGGENIFAELSSLAPQVSLEAVLVENPQAILAGGKQGDRQKLIQYWLKWDSIAAVKKDSVFVIHPDIIQRHTPRIIQGAQQMCAYLDQVRQDLDVDRVENASNQH